MPKLPLFGSQELIKALKKLGFEIDESRGKGGHYLAKHPEIKPGHGQRPFITIRGMKEYGDPGFRSKVINEIRAFGFSREEIIEALKS